MAANPFLTEDLGAYACAPNVGLNPFLNMGGDEGINQSANPFSDNAMFMQSYPASTDQSLSSNPFLSAMDDVPAYNTGADLFGVGEMTNGIGAASSYGMPQPQVNGMQPSLLGNESHSDIFVGVNHQTTSDRAHLFGGDTNSHGPFCVNPPAGAT